jgi:hypothetical protein
MRYGASCMIPGHAPAQQTTVYLPSSLPRGNVKCKCSMIRLEFKPGYDQMKRQGRRGCMPEHRFYSMRCVRCHCRRTWNHAIPPQAPPGPDHLLQSGKTRLTPTSSECSWKSAEPADGVQAVQQAHGCLQHPHVGCWRILASSAQQNHGRTRGEAATLALPPPTAWAHDSAIALRSSV